MCLRLGIYTFKFRIPLSEDRHIQKSVKLVAAAMSPAEATRRASVTPSSRIIKTAIRGFRRAMKPRAAKI